MSLQPTERFITPVPVSEIPLATREHLLRAAGDVRRFEGVVVPGDPPACLFTIYTEHDARSIREALSGRGEVPMFIFPWGWPGVFGAGLSLTAAPLRARLTGPAPAVTLCPSHPAFPGIQPGTFQAVFAHDRQVVAAALVDLRNLRAADYPAKVLERLAEWAADCLDSGSGVFFKQWNHVALHVPALPDPEASYWEILAHREIYLPWLTSKELLSVGWALWQADYVQVTNRVLQDARAKEAIGAYQGDELPPVIVELIRVMGSYSLVQIIDYIVGVHNAGELRSLVVLPPAFDRFSESETQGYLAASFGGAMHCYLRGAAQTQCGRRVSWVDSDCSLCYTQLEPRDFPPDSPVREYWSRLGGVCLNFGSVVSGSDFPADLRLKSELWDSMPLAEDVPEVLATRDGLLDEALAGKQWVVPPDATVEMPVGPFVEFELTEIFDEVYFVARTAKNEFAVITVEPSARRVWVSGTQSKDSDRFLATSAAIGLLAAAVVRDFWVVENRERVFQVRERRGGIRLATEGGGRRVVYLPRVRYTGQADTHECVRALALEERVAHAVRAHLRKTEGRSATQVALAARYGFIVPPGHTFVRPHRRGARSAEVVYRSRSALESLYVLSEETGGPPVRPRWFQFERDVSDLMKALGFTVEHVAAARNGDRGIDVLASKGADLDRVEWAIQCKCYRPQRRVGPDIVRGLLGTLESLPRGTCGMIVTTARFTAAATELAEQVGIRLIDGEEFAHLLECTGRGNRSL